jgi:hypothetical protein
MSSRADSESLDTWPRVYSLLFLAVTLCLLIAYALQPQRLAGLIQEAQWIKAVAKLILVPGA